MTSLILELRVTSYTYFIYLCQGDDIYSTLERIESKHIMQPLFMSQFLLENQK